MMNPPQWTPEDALRRIDADHAAGRIDSNQRDVYRAQVMAQATRQPHPAGGAVRTVLMVLGILVAIGVVAWVVSALGS